MKIALSVGIIASAFLMPLSAHAQKREPVWISGIIKEFGCGDSCYLTILKEDFGRGKEETGKCNAKVCIPWVQKMEMPKSFLGRKVRIRLGIDWIYDGEYDKSGYTISFEEIIILR